MKRFWAVALALTAAFLMFLCVFLVPQATATTSPTEGAWEQMASMSTARTSMGVVVVDGKIYVIGGYTGVYISSNEEYNPQTNSWTNKHAMPTARGAFATAVVDNKIYCIGGGWTGINEVYDPATDTWATKTAMPTGRWACVATAVNGKIYVMGGFNTAMAGTPIACNINEMYDPTTGTWTTMASMPDKRAYCISAVVDDKIYLFGGTTIANVIIYDPQTNSWSTWTSLPDAAYDSGGATTGVYSPRNIYLFGSDETLIYDLQTGTYAYGPVMPTSRMYSRVAVVDDRFYAIGGENTNGPVVLYATNERYTPANYYVAPSGQVLSPQNSTAYNSTSVSLQFTVTGQAASFCYSLDGGENVSVAGNATLGGLTSGVHNVTVYALDSQGNSFTIQTTAFTVSLEDAVQTKSEIPEIAVVVAGVAIAVAAVAAAILVLYRRKHQKPAQTTQI